MDLKYLNKGGGKIPKRRWLINKKNEKPLNIKKIKSTYSPIFGQKIEFV